MQVNLKTFSGIFFIMDVSAMKIVLHSTGEFVKNSAIFEGEVSLGTSCALSMDPDGVSYKAVIFS